MHAIRLKVCFRGEQNGCLRSCLMLTNGEDRIMLSSSKNGLACHLLARKAHPVFLFETNVVLLAKCGVLHENRLRQLGLTRPPLHWTMFVIVYLVQEETGARRVCEGSRERLTYSLCSRPCVLLCPLGAYQGRRAQDSTAMGNRLARTISHNLNGKNLRLICAGSARQKVHNSFLINVSTVER